MTTFADFLTAKRTVEDRALNRVVFQQFVDALADRGADRGADKPVRIVEIGVGTGSMIARLADWDVLPPSVSYRAVDLDPEQLAVARRQLPEQLRAAGYSVEATEQGMIARKETGDGHNRRLDITLAVDDGFEITDSADAVIAGAVLDLVDLPAAVEDLKGLLADEGLLYAPATFNGHTSFTPREPLDDRIEGLYHRHMDEIRDQLGRFGNAWGYSSLAAFETRAREVEDLYQSICEQGYRRQHELDPSLRRDRLAVLTSEINVDIGRDGELYWRSYGQHRLAIAQLLGVERVPVVVHRRHRHWQAVRDRLRTSGRVDSLDPEYRDHPNLQHLIESNRD